MNTLLLATAVFLLTHMGISSTPLRGLLLRRLGEKPYQGLYALVALAALVWMVMAYNAAPRETLWIAGPVLHALPLVVMPFALLALVAGVSGPNPTAAGQPFRLGEDEPVRGILRITRHPVQWSIALWAAAHLLASGEAAAVVFFGGLLLLSLAGAPLIDRRKRAAVGEAWAPLAAATSVVPFAAILAGRNRFVPGEIGWVRLAVALALYVVLIGVHPVLFGADPY